MIVLSESSGGGGSYFHWPLEFPEVFFRDNPGFDAVVTNPPFVKSVKSTKEGGCDLSKYYKIEFPVFSDGASDYCLNFWGLITQYLLKNGGGYGVVSPTSLLSHDKGWQKWVHENWRPRMLLVQSPELFSAGVRTTVYIGDKQGKNFVEVSRFDVCPSISRNVSWKDEDVTWYSAVSRCLESPSSNYPSGGVRVGADNLKNDFIMLGKACDIWSGCATGAAYDLKEEVVDGEGEGLKLVTTGVIDRYKVYWGERAVRFLKGDYSFPRWPESPASRSVASALGRQRFPKVIVAGLTDVIESFPDVNGEYGGVVSTWCLKVKVDGGLPVPRLASLLNSASFSRIYMGSHGASGLSGGQVTIKKAGLSSSLVPSAVLHPKAGLTGGLPPSLDSLMDSDCGTVIQVIDFLSSVIFEVVQEDEEWESIDYVLHYLWAALYGRSFENDYSWWKSRVATGHGLTLTDSWKVVERAFNSKLTVS